MAGLIDELLLFVSPLAIGSGKSLFSGLAEEKNLTLLEARVFNESVVLLRYLPQEETEKGN